MTATTGLQGRIIGAGLLAAIGVLVYGTVVSETIAGVEATVATTWIFVATFAVLAVAHASVGRYDLTLGHGGAAVGWLLVLLGTIGLQVVLGLMLLVLSGCYIAIRTVRHGTAEDGTETGTTQESA
ncbi:hypothetical protein HYG81_12745 [Natrinema zhouii]|uniref:Uncharacterized protein n=1 Tax=Natrinema zhouii TaxID=1710539 RepID=A0A7D6CPG8_9EURY|nr:hypothetical protein [Natrinema zhouii]QLK24973.1 hypothetical protein HYG81_12745 [Natrinema zhouii]